MAKVTQERDPSKAYTTRELAEKSGLAESTARRKVKKWRMSWPVDMAEFMRRLGADPPDSSLARPSVAERQSREPSPPVDSSLAPTLDQLEDSIRRTTDKDEAERLSKQVRSLKAMQEVREREGRTVNVDSARADIEAVFTLFQTTWMSKPKNMAAALVGLTALELETVLEGWIVETLAELRRGLERAIAPESKDVRGDSAGAGATGEIASEPVGGTVSNSDAAANVASGSVEKCELPVRSGADGSSVQAAEGAKNMADEGGADSGV